MKQIFLLVTITVLSLIGLQAQTTSNPTESAQSFGVFVKGNAALKGSQAEGSVAMGGNLSLVSGNFTVAANSSGSFAVSGINIGLLVGGKIDYTNGGKILVNNGYLKIGDGTGSTVWYKDNNNNTGSNLQVNAGSFNSSNGIQLQRSASALGVSSTVNPVIQSGLIDFNAAFTKFTATSTCLKGYASKISLTDPNGNAIATTNLPSQVKVNLVNGTNVLNITGTDLNNVSNFTFNNQPDASKVLVINVNAAGSYTWKVWNQAGIGNSSAPYIIYNFYNTTALTIDGNAIEGTVFAPYATINKTSSSNIDGQVIGLSLSMSSGGGSINNYPFKATLATCATCTPTSSTTYASICSGSTYRFTRSMICRTSGTYTATLINAAGCDSIATLILTVNDKTYSTTNAAICPGGGYTFNGTTYKTAGTYTATLKNAGGCDSVATLILSIKSTSVSSTSATICQSGSYTFNGTTYRTPGTYTAMLTNSVGCDSTASLVLAYSANATNMWTGAVSNNWSTAGNWCNNVVPSITSDVLISTDAPNMPSVAISTVKNLTLVAGTTLNVTGLMQIAGNIQVIGTAANGIINATNGVIEMNGTTAQKIPAGVFVNKTVQNLTINNAAGVTLEDTLKVTGALLPTQGTLITNDKLVLKSSATGTARIAAGTGNYISGNVTVERYITPKAARKYSFVGATAPQSVRNGWQNQIYITGAGNGGTPCGAGSGNGGANDKYNSNGFDKTVTNTPTVYTYNESPVNGTRWVAIKSTSDSLIPGKGYRVNIRGDRNSSTASCNDQLNSNTPTSPQAVTLSTTGKVNMGDVTVALNNPSVHKYTLLANPYPSQISFSAFQATNSGIISNKVWCFSPFGNGNYATYSVGLIANAAQGYDNTNSNYIAVGQAFFVEASTNGSVTFKENHKIAGNIPNTQFFGTANNKLMRIGLNSNTNALLDEVVVRFNGYGSTSYSTDWDATSFSGSAQSLAIIKGAYRLAIATRPDNFQIDTVQLSVKSSTAGSFRLSMSDFAGLNTLSSITLRDKFLGTSINVDSVSTYDFSVTSDSLSKGDNRFELVFKAGGTTLPVHFTNITAAKKEQSVAVKWEVSKEINVAAYTVERSIDGVRFLTIATVKAIGSTGYTALDNQPSTTAKAYYRIKANDLNGAATYSQMVVVSNNASTEAIEVIASSNDIIKLNISLSETKDVQFVLTSMNGKSIVLKNMNLSKGNNSLSLSLPTSLSAGIYSLKAIGMNGENVKKFMVK